MTVRFLLGITLPLLAAATPVIRCTSPSGELLFTQFACPIDSTEISAASDRGALSVVRATPLTAAEERALEDLARTLDRQRADRRKVRDRRRRENRQRQAEARARCAQAGRRLAELDGLRRQGYRAAQERRWDLEAARWRAIRRADC